MKKFSALAVMIAIVTVFLGSCANGNSIDESTVTDISDIVAPWSEAEVFTMPSEETSAASENASEKTSAASADEKTTNAALTDSQAREIIYEAKTIYNLFVSSTPSIDKENPVEYEEGLFVYRITDTSLDTEEEIEALLSKYFSEAIISNLMGIGRYVTIENVLYAVDVNMSTATIESEKFTVVSDTDKMQTIDVTATTSNGEKTYTFVRELIDGKWIFTTFRCYW